MHLFYPLRPPVLGEFLQLLCVHSFSDFDVQDKYGATALHRAASWGTAEDVRLLLQAGASPSIPDKERGWIPIFDAVSNGNTKAVEVLAKHTLGLPNAVDLQGWTMLPIAIQTGDLETMRIVLELGVNPHYLVKLRSQTDAVIHEVTPVEFSQLQGPEIHKNFLTALKLVGFDVSSVSSRPGELDNEYEGAVFWPAESGEDSKEFPVST